MVVPRIKVCDKCYLVNTSKMPICAYCESQLHNQKEKPMTKRWTKQQDKKLLKLVEEYKAGGLKFCEAYKRMSKTMGRTPSAIMQRHNKLMNIHIATEYSDEKLQKILSDSGAYDYIDPPLILDMSAGGLNYTGGSVESKPKTFIEKIKLFFKGGKNV